MATVIFYEKPGCINNTQQKKRLVAAGHLVDARNLLTTAWTAETLGQFLGTVPTAQCFNRSAPQVKDGSVIPEAMDRTQTIALMIANPILIRRPLMQVGKEYRMGFNQEGVDTWIGLTQIDTDKDLESCPRSHQQTA